VLQNALEVAAEIRAAGATCEVYLEPSAKLAKQFSYADAKGIPFVVVVGPDEVAKGVVQLNDLAKREQVEIPRADLAAAVANIIGRT
ncbi:MAG: His/Gly/Thr/Pro-type tRNA ligase C-terminal domain-containing protein, partial [bacterium]